MLSSAARRVSTQFPRSPQKAYSQIPTFDLKLFLDSAGLGRTVVGFKAKETIFTQGDPAKTVIYIQEGSVKLTVVNETGKEAVVAILGLGDFFWGRLPSRSGHLHGHGDDNYLGHRAGY